MDSNKSEKNTSNRPVIGITIGDINGIGPEVIMKTLSDSRITNHMTPIIYGSTKTLSYYRKSLNLHDFNYSQVKQANAFLPKKVNVVNCWDEAVEIRIGESTKEAGKCSRLALEKATNDLSEENIDAIVTGPINKNNVHSDEFNFAGHTEFLAKKFGQGESLMMMVSSSLRIAVVTGHIPLSKVAGTFNAELFNKKLKMLEGSLINDFGIAKPKIAVLGMNPHSGEEGLLGTEEKDIIIPSIKELKAYG